MERHITIVAMTSWLCNLDCIYCYAKATKRNDLIMNKGDTGTFIKNCSSGFDSVEFCWHGGEPLLMGKEFYKEVVKNQQKISSEKGIKFKNIIQTNGGLLDQSWLEFLKENNFSVGLSVDAPLEIHLKQRPDTENKMTSQDWRNIWQNVKDYKGSLGCLCVITKSNVNKAKDIFEFFKEINAGTYSLLPLKTVPIIECDIAPTNEELTRLYCDTFELWMNSENNFTSIEPLETMIKGLIGGYPSLCSFSASCLKRMITIDPTGNAVPCAALVEDKFILGNIFQERLLNIINNQATAIFKSKRAYAIKKYCKECEYISICRGGCRNTAFWDSGDYGSKYPYCDSRKEVFNYLKNRLNQILVSAKCRKK